MQHVERVFAGRRLCLETGRLAKQAAGSAVVQFGETMVLAAVTVHRLVGLDTMLIGEGHGRVGA